MASPVYTIAAIIVFVGFIAQSISSYVAEARFKKAHGTQPVRKLPQSERILGYGLYKIQKQAMKDQNLLDVVKKRYDDNGTTYSAYLMGQVFVNTVEPENIKAILATNFKDFGLGERIRSLGPLLGQGIFTSDGAIWEHSRVCNFDARKP